LRSIGPERHGTIVHQKLFIKDGLSFASRHLHARQLLKRYRTDENPLRFRRECSGDVSDKPLLWRISPRAGSREQVQTAELIWNSVDQRIAFIAANLGILATTDGDQAPTAFNFCDGLMRHHDVHFDVVFISGHFFGLLPVAFLAAYFRLFALR
jgi:hypothetical protein